MPAHWLVCVALLPACAGLAAQERERPASPDTAHGRRLFEAQCARCHGMDATGGAGPSLARPTLRHAPSDSALIEVITNGIDGTAMPGAWQLVESDVRDVAGFVRSRGRIAATPLPGDTARGRSIYETHGCPSCHIVRGRGGSLGPDLTAVGAQRGVAYLREVVVNPAAGSPGGSLRRSSSGYREFLVVRAVTRGGRVVRGVRINEDPFTIQLRDASGAFHSFDKAALRTLERHAGESLMPSARDGLSARELDDLVAYLASLRGAF